MNLIDVPRNDIEAARQYHDEHKPLSNSEVHALLQLQDDPTRLLDVMRDEGWETEED